MERQAFLILTSLGQWGLFIAIIMFFYGKVEKKKTMVLSAYILFILLGIYASWVHLFDIITVPVLSETTDVPIEAKALAFFFGVIITGLLAALAIFFQKKDKQKLLRITSTILILLCVILLYVVYNLQKTS